MFSCPECQSHNDLVAMEMAKSRKVEIDYLLSGKNITLQDFHFKAPKMGKDQLLPLLPEDDWLLPEVLKLKYSNSIITGA